MIYLNKLLSKIKENSAILKSAKLVFELGITSSQIKDLKKYALENQLITQSKNEFFLTSKGEDYLKSNPLEDWKTEEFPNRPNINLEYLKEEKSPSTLTKAIRNYAKFLLDNQPLKEFSLEHLLSEDVKKCMKISSKIENDILSGKKLSLEKVFDKYISQGLTKSLIATILLSKMVENIDRIAIYEKSQFQLKLDCLMFDRMIACPEHFEIQKTEIEDEFILKDVSKIILNKKSNNILEITKGLYKSIKELDKYTMKTENMSKKTLRLRNVIVNAKDPISLFERDIPKVLSGKTLQDCDREFLNDLKKSLEELKSCTKNLEKEIKEFIFKSFQAKNKEELSERFLKIKEFLNEKELKVLLNTVVEIDVPDSLWINRIATFINKSRVPKDWSDEDYADFKVKTCELALKFSVLEATVGTNEKVENNEFYSLLNMFLKLTKSEKMIFLRKAINS